MESLTPETYEIVHEGDEPLIANNNALLQNKNSGELLWAPWFVIKKNFYGNVSEEEVQEDEYQEPQNNKTWTKEMTVLLINKIENAQEAFEKDLKKNVWAKIATECSNGTTIITPKQAETKWKSLKRTYKSVSIHNKTTGQKRRYWEYFDLIHQFMFRKPEIVPEATCSSFTGLKVRSDVNESTSSESVASISHSNPSYESSFTKKRKQRETEANTRHKEKMQRFDRFNDLFSDLVQAYKEK